MSTDEAIEPLEDDLPEQMRIRQEKRARLIESGKAAYPVTVPVTHTIGDIRASHPDLVAGTETGEVVGIAGRVMFVRNTGRLAFVLLRAGDGAEIQGMLSEAVVGPEALEDFKHLVDIGDHLYLHGEVISSKRGELSVMADEWQMAAKALRPLPVAHKALSEESRVRQRYVDLIMRPEARANARTRVWAVASLRSSLMDRGFLEVETPMLQTMHGGATARPFVTRSNAFDLELFMRIAPELFLKRAVVGGLDSVFEINRNFRNEGADSSHSPEFAMLEAYLAYADYHDMARLTRELIQEAAIAVCGSTKVTHWDGSEHELGGEWPMVPMYPAISTAVGREVSPTTSRDELVTLCKDAGISVDPLWVAGKLAEELFEHYVAPNFQGPTFVTDFPIDTSPLVKNHRSIPGVVEKWDLYVDGFELATGYSELNDPIIQRERLVEQSRLGERGDVEAMRLDEDFLRALEYGMPPLGGIGMGVDRLLMALTGLGIRETILFPLVKPEQR
jgi:lysyl-tRNA synthetase class 2